MAGSLPLSVTPPPSDPVDLRDWLAAREEQIARAVRATVVRILTDAYTAWADSLTAAGDMSAFDAIPSEWQRYVDGELIAELGGVYQQGALATWITIPEALAAVETFATAWTEVVNTDAVQYATQATNRLSNVGQTMYNDIKQVISKGIEAGQSIPELQDQVQQVTRFSEARAEAIARTETLGAYNGGNYDAATALGEWAPVEKVWLAGIDSRTRPTHIEADGQVVAFGDPFIVGGVPMDRPHDPSAPAKEVVQCRCIWQALYPGNTRPDGSVVPMPDTVPAVVETETAGELVTIDPLAEQAEKARLTRASAARDYYLEQRATPQTAAQYAAEYGLDADSIIVKRENVRALRAQVRESAARHAGEVFGTLDDVGGLRLYRPSRGPGSWDAWELLSDGEKKRLGRYTSTRPGQGRLAFDQMAENARNRGYVSVSASDDEVFDWWLQQTRTMDQAHAIARGRLPASRSYGRIDTQLAARTDVDVDELFGVHIDEAAARLASQEIALQRREYLDLLDAAVNPRNGPEAWTYGFQTWEKEVRDLAFGLDNFPNEMPDWASARLEELLPRRFREFDSLEDSYAALIETAKQAGMRVPDYAVIPWA